MFDGTSTTIDPRCEPNASCKFCYRLHKLYVVFECSIVFHTPCSARLHMCKSQGIRCSFCYAFYDSNELIKLPKIIQHIDISMKNICNDRLSNKCFKQKGIIEILQQRLNRKQLFKQLSIRNRNCLRPMFTLHAAHGRPHSSGSFRYVFFLSAHTIDIIICASVMILNFRIYIYKRLSDPFHSIDWTILSILKCVLFRWST